MKATSVSAAILIGLVSLTISGCANAPSPQMKDSLAYVHQHKGEGARRILVGTEAQLVDEATRILELSYVVTREPNALFAKLRDTSISFSYAFYFYPAQVTDRTEVEALMANILLRGGPATENAIADFFPLANLSTRLLEPDFDVNVKEGGNWKMLPLSIAAFYDSRALAKKLIGKGANAQAAIDELRGQAAFNRDYRDRAENNRTYERANAGVALLESLKSGAREAEGTGTPPAPAVPKAASGKGDIADRLRKLDDLKRQGLVTEQEYQRKKQELLDQL